MANPPVPQSYQQILGNEINTFLSRFGTASIITGSPILRILEASAQSDFKSSSGVFQLLRSLNLEFANGQALQQIAADENIPLITESPASGPVNIIDSSFTKISTQIYQGLPAPIVGSSIIFVADASQFPGTGSLYIGRGTSHYEGPLSYTSVTQIGAYWQVNLAGGNSTQVFHNLGESVVVAQGGNRDVPAGTIVTNGSGNTTLSVQFSSLYDAVVLDGETEVDNVLVTATTPGTIGNVSANSINAFVSPPFAGATVINVVPFTNGTANESDDALRERIKDVRASRSQGTALAITTGVLGLTSSDENNRITSATVVSSPGLPTTLYIDDGKGYEEIDQGIAFETLVASALGGEQQFQVAASRPVAKAFVTTNLSSPFTLVDECILSATVAGLTYQHAFAATSFNNIGNATAFEVVSSINDDINFPFSARTANSGTQVTLFADQDTDEAIQVTVPEGDVVDANSFLEFPITFTDTMNLFKNDKILSKDGRTAVLVGASQSSWTSFTGTQTIQIRVDGADPLNSAPTYTITAADFIAAGTIYSTVTSTNSLASWAAVFNFKIPGITASVNGSSISLVSNAGPVSKAALDIVSGTLVTNGMFTNSSGLTSVGLPSDYVLDRNRGQIFLNTPLQPGDTLTIGTSDARAFIQSGFLFPVTLSGTANLWFSIDGNAQIVQTGLSNVATLTSSAGSGTNRVRWTATGGTAPYFLSNIKIGDWVVLTDSAFNSSNLGAWRIDFVDPSGAYFEITRTSFVTEAVNASANGITFVRTTSYLQLVPISAASNLTATALAPLISAELTGGFAEVYKTNFLRIRTDTYGTGDIALVATNTLGLQLLLPVSGALTSSAAIPASVVTATVQSGTPNFLSGTMSAGVSKSAFLTTTSNFDIGGASWIVGLRSLPLDVSAAIKSSFDSNLGYSSVVSSFSSTQVNLRDPVLEEWVPNSRYYVGNGYGIGPLDTLAVLVDGDIVSGRYSFNMFRRISPTTSTYGSSNQFFDVDNGGASLSSAFGFGVNSFNFNDFAIVTNARAKSHAESGDTTKTILWRSVLQGGVGNDYHVQYGYPALPSLPVQVQSSMLLDAFNEISINLPSGATRTGFTVRNTTKIGYTLVTTGGLKTATFFLGLKITSASRTSDVTTLTLDIGTPGATDSGLLVNDVVFVNSTNINFGSGLFTITGRSASTIAYTETAADQGATANIGNISNDVGLATLAGSTAVTGDIVALSAAAGVPSWAQVPMRTTTIDTANGQYWQGLLANTDLVGTTIHWAPLNASSALSIFPLASTGNQAGQIATAVNTLAAAANSVCPVTAVAVGSGGVSTGVIAFASYEDPAGPMTVDYGYQLTDGINYIASVTNPTLLSNNYTFTYKLPINGTLTSNSDWLNQQLSLVPVTALNMVNFLNAPAISGLFSATTVETANRGNAVEISSLTLGNTGSVQVQGGAANFSAGSVVSASIVDEGNGRTQTFSMQKADALGLLGAGWVTVQNTSLANRNIFTSTMNMESISIAGLVTLDHAMWNNVGTFTNNFWQIERQGNYVAIAYANPLTSIPDLSHFSVGDWAVFDNTSVTTPAISSSNIGTFRVVAIDVTNGVIWIENPNVTEEVSWSNINIIQDGSILPGDTFSVHTTAFGAEKVGTWLVTASYTLGSQDEFQVAAVGWSTYTGPTVLGTNANLLVITEGTADRFTKQLLTVGPNQQNSNLMDVKLNDDVGIQYIGPANGTVVTALDKLSFPTGLAIGTEAYEHAVGLIGAANLVAYGDPQDPTLYPGIIAADADINIQGPLVRRITVSLQIRVFTGVTISDIIENVKNAVASVINSAGIGQAIAISDIADAAAAVNGVQAVTIVSPVWTTTNDVLDIQPDEKPLVLNVDQDISVTLAGT